MVGNTVHDVCFAWQYNSKGYGYFENITVSVGCQTKHRYCTYSNERSDNLFLKVRSVFVEIEARELQMKNFKAVLFSVIVDF